MNVDPKEIQKFSDLAKTWWDPRGPYQSLHDINPLRIEFIESCVDLKDKVVLDVGCGGGLLAERFAALGANVMAIDQSSESLNVARIHSQDRFSIDYRETSAEVLAQTLPNQFDIVTCLEVLEHVPDPVSLVSACARLAKPNGHVFFSTINRNLKSYLFAIVAAEYVLGLLPKGMHEYAKFIRPSELVAWGRKADLDVLKFRGIGYQPLSKRYFLTESIDVNYLAYFRRLS
jgi:2-polyprenyl-6-hydroxyphenyl methylase / 3-demethylubiquinone-9 3-methyltransferase